MNPERLVNNAALRALVNRASFSVAEALLAPTLSAFVLPRSQRRKMLTRVEAHLAQYLPDMSELERRRCVREFARNWSRKMADDVITLSLRGPERFRRLFAERFFFQHEERLAQAIAAGRGVLLVGSHVGSVTLATAALYSLLLGVPARDRPAIRTCCEPEIERFPSIAASIGETLQDFGVNISFILTSSGRSSVAKQMCSALERGELVTTNIDVLTGGSSPLAFPFLSGPKIRLPAAVGAAKVALSTGATVLPWCNHRTGSGYTVHFEPPIGPLPRSRERMNDDHPEVLSLAAQLAGILSDWVQQWPAQWVYWDRLYRRTVSREKDPTA